MSQRFVSRDEWRANRLQILLAGGKHDEEEPDWFGLHYRVPVDSTLSFKERMKQWDENVEPFIKALAEASAGKISVVTPLNGGSS